MRRLQVDPSDIEAIVCSHGHLRPHHRARRLDPPLGPVKLPVLIHPQFWRRRRVLIHGRDPHEVPTTSRRALAGAGVRGDRGPAAQLLVRPIRPGDRRGAPHHRLRARFPPQQAWLGGRWEPDPLVLDEQALIVDIKDKGLVVITGCGHAGIVNICRYARRLTKERPLYTVMGGFHLSGPIFEPLILRVLDDLGALRPSVIVPAHCTGWRASTPSEPASARRSSPTPSAPASSCDPQQPRCAATSMGSP